ncbi:hypothetical protein P3X46_002694 [Hevea brasiliensis]|uniref:Protein kinase domain-containing protein n=2 Tax=Hevea brasiliensis TaxID=3981 RepID=A0ABQ9N8R1_HEVBR|nr:hypothetical protein P3X46_002694 [Hevea brasiliensis]
MQMTSKAILLPLPLLLLHIGGIAAGMTGEDRRRKLEEEHGMRFDYSFSSGFVIGYVFSVVSVVTIFMSYCVPWSDFKKINKTKTSSPITLLKARPQIRGAMKQIPDLEKLSTRISFTALNNATESFDEHNLIGFGKKGKLYKAKLPYYDCLAAVKRFYNSRCLVKQCFSELMILGKFKHINIVPLLGFCIESTERLLVYKYMPNGNLYDWLHPMNYETKILDFHLRIKIAIGVARGLVWLHHNNFLIIHGNLCSSCILLDRNFEPKISNFGGAMFFSKSGSKELRLIQSDVYKYGVLLLELILGQDFYMPKETFKERISHPSTTIDTLYRAVDKSLIGRGNDAKIFSLLDIARGCVKPLPDERPTMLQVYKMLMDVKKINNGIEDYSETLTETDTTFTGFSDDNIELEIIEI